jgi:hypothetical protein
MKWIRSRRPSPALVISVIALCVALAGTAGALPGRNSVKSNDIARGAVRARDLGGVAVRTEPIRDVDSVANDGIWTPSANSAACRRGERLISGGVRTGGFPAPASVVVSQSEPRESKRLWVVSIASDAGGAAHHAAVAMCLKR